MSQATATVVLYVLTYFEIAFSGAVVAKTVTFEGPKALSRALTEADRLFELSSMSEATVTQRGGARSGKVHYHRVNPDAHVAAGTSYCAGIRHENGQWMSYSAVSQDSRLPRQPVSYVREVL